MSSYEVQWSPLFRGNPRTLFIQGDDALLAFVTVALTRYLKEGSDSNDVTIRIRDEKTWGKRDPAQ